MGNATPVVAEVAGYRHLIDLDRGHKLQIKSPTGPAVTIDSRPVTEYSAAVDTAGRLHVAAWLLSRHLMYYMSEDGQVFSRSTLLKSDGGLRLRHCLVSADSGVSVVYVAETEYANTLVSYRYEGGEWEGRRVVEVDLPQRLTAWQYDGSPAGASILYCVKEPGRTVILSRQLTGDTPPEQVTTVAGGLTDFCALTSGGVRHACWLADGQMMLNGVKQTEDSWSRTWPYLKRGENGVLCQWLENSQLCGVIVGAQRVKLKSAAVNAPLPCMLALPGEVRKAVVDGLTLQEPVLQLPEVAERPQTKASAAHQSQTVPVREREAPRPAAADLTLTDVVRNQAIFLTRMQESLSAMERNMLRVQSEVNRLTKEVGALIKEKELPPKPEPMLRVASFRQPGPAVEIIIEQPPEPVPEAPCKAEEVSEEVPAIEAGRESVPIAEVAIPQAEGNDEEAELSFVEEPVANETAEQPDDLDSELKGEINEPFTEATVDQHDEPVSDAPGEPPAECEEIAANQQDEPAEGVVGDQEPEPATDDYVIRGEMGEEEYGGA